MTRNEIAAQVMLILLDKALPSEMVDVPAISVKLTDSLFKELNKNGTIPRKNN